MSRLSSFQGCRRSLVFGEWLVGVAGLNECSFSLLSVSVSTLGSISLPFCNATRSPTLSINPDVDGCGFRRSGRRRKRGAIQCGEHGSGIPIYHGEQRPSRRFWSPPSALPVLDGIKAEAERIREFRLRHTQSTTDRLDVHFLGDMCLESFLLPGKEILNIVKATHHLVELRFHATSRRSRKYCRHVS
jgi:hypothetical protein